MKSAAFSLLHIEDDALWCRVITTVADAMPEVRKFAAAHTGAQGLALARTQPPDIVLLDLRLPDTEGFGLSRQLAELPVPPRVLLLSARQDEAALHHAFQPHIAGVLWKNRDTPRFLPEALHAAAAGRKYYAADAAVALRRFRANPTAFNKILSDRERGLIAHFGCGLGDAEIAARLEMGAFTVRSHRQRIMQKLGLHRSIDLMHWAIRTGLAGLRGEGRAPDG